MELFCDAKPIYCCCYKWFTSGLFDLVFVHTFKNIWYIENARISHYVKSQALEFICGCRELSPCVRAVVVKLEVLKIVN